MGVVTAVILVVSISISFLLIYVPNMHIIALQFEDSKLTGGRVSVMDMLLSNDYLEEEVTTETEDILKGHQIRLTLPQNVTSRSVSIENDYVTKTISITIEGIGKDYFDDYCGCNL